jgi:hypothetical protein
MQGSFRGVEFRPAQSRFDAEHASNQHPHGSAAWLGPHASARAPL